MKPTTLFSLIVLATVEAGDFIRTNPFRHLGREPYNISLERTTSRRTPLVSRGDDDNADKVRWGKAVCKGAQLLATMAGDEQRAGNMFKPPLESSESDFQDYSELKKWGYDYMDYNEYINFEKSLPIKDALASLKVHPKIDRDDKINLCVAYEHEWPVTIDGTTYLPTGARFTTVFNPTDGVIIAWASYGPRYEGAQKSRPITVLPKLQWIDKAHKAGKDPTNLKYVFRSPVHNTGAL